MNKLLQLIHKAAKENPKPCITCGAIVDMIDRASVLDAPSSGALGARTDGRTLYVLFDSPEAATAYVRNMNANRDTPTLDEALTMLARLIDDPAVATEAAALIKRVPPC